MAKIGEGHADAMARLGLKELRNAFNPARESVADSELGLYGTATQLEVGEQRGVSQETTTMADLDAAAQKQEQQENTQENGQEQERGGRGR